MNDPIILKNEDETAIALKELYRQYGYKLYKMSKFEPYELYAENKNFLVSDRMITFTDSKGKLMALRPDVTLSIIKNFKSSGETQKLFYRENVYRKVKNENEIREILQMGLECVGDVGIYETAEVLSLAAKSLESISPSYVIDISHMGFISGLLSETKAGNAVRNEIISCIKAKNMHDIYKICHEAGIHDIYLHKLAEAAALWGPFEDIIPKLKELSVNSETESAIIDLENIYEQLKISGNDKHFKIDLSVTHDINYYDKVVFSGFIEGIPVNVLTGGRYDKLLERLGKTESAIGFAVYLGLIAEYTANSGDYNTDVIIYYNNDSDIKTLTSAACNYSRSKKSISVRKIKGSISEHTDSKKTEEYFLKGKELIKLC